MNLLDIITDYRISSIILGIFILYLIFWYSTRNYSYWKKRGIPSVKPYPFIGSFMIYLRKNIEVADVENYKKYGRIYGFYEGSKPQITIAEPELLRDIFVKDFQYFSCRRIFISGDPITDKMMSSLEGEDWKRVRSIVSPTFSTGKIKRVLSIFHDCSKTLIQNFKTASENHEKIDVLRFYGAFTMDVIASAAFSTKIDSHNYPENNFIKMAKKIFQLSMNFKFLLFLLIPGLLRKLKIGILDSKSMEFFKNVTLEILKERKKTGEKRNDFLQLLIDSADEVSNEEKWDEKSEDIVANYGDDSIDHPIFKNTSKKHLSMDELVAQCVIFFLAGYHTTAATLGITTYLLALNQTEQEKLYNEISDVLRETNGELTYEAVQKMKYLDNIISESLRMYSPAIRLERTANDDYKLGDTGIEIPKGMLVIIPVFAMQTDPKLFPEPKRFNPERFSSEEREKQIIPYSYLPFGAGPRNCVGMRFALTELKVCLINVFSTFHVKTCTETKIPLEFGRGQGLLQPLPIMLRLELRDKCPLKT